MTALDLFGEQLEVDDAARALPTHRECESCGAAITWARTRAGKAMPVNAEPDSYGNLLLTEHRGEARVGILLARQAAAARAEGSRLHLSHFATCSRADQWRRR